MLYRCSQFFRGFFAKLTPDDEQQVQQMLSPSECALFYRMPLDARRHSLNVYQTLLGAGQDHPDLAVAALLHDVGKVAAEEAGVKLGLWMRIPLVLIEATRPQLIRYFASADPADGWRYTLMVHLDHPQIGAEWAEEAGTSPLGCWLIRSHQDEDPTISSALSLPAEAKELLAALQWADSRN